MHDQRDHARGWFRKQDMLLATKPYGSYDTEAGNERKNCR